MLCSARGYTLSILLLLLAVVLIALALVVLILPAVTNKRHLGRQKANEKRRRLAIERAKLRPHRYSTEGKAAFDRAKRFMQTCDHDHSPALTPETKRYVPVEVCLQAESERGKTPITLRAQLLNASDVRDLPEFSAQQQQATPTFREKKWVIAVHGYHGCGDDLLCEAYFFMERGYNVLLPDLRGHGKSEGTYIGMGWHDRLDIRQWAGYLTKTYPDCQIVLYGVSMGAAAVMMASGAELPANVRCIVEDCGYTSAWEEFRYLYKSKYHVPVFPMLFELNFYTRLCYGYDLKEASALEQVRRATLPMLFLHGGRDGFVPTAFISQLYAACGSTQKEMQVFDEAKHAQSMRCAYGEYWKKVDGFLQKYC